jgi:protein-ribulosamine 3-kinase
MLAKNLESAICQFLSEKHNTTVVITNVSPISGGCINEASRLITNVGSFFVKWNNASRFPLMFEKEAVGLKILKDAQCISVPSVEGFGEYDNVAWLLLAFIEPQNQLPSFWENFGSSLAKQHKVSSENFGLFDDNYIGSLHQHNTPNQDWVEFFITQRLEKQIKLAKNKGVINNDIIKKFENLYKYLPEFFPTEPPSLLHGDLWSGNFMTGNNGLACIYDPAVYYGHRLMDIGMSKLFGGFSNSFYSYYNENYPLENNWQEAVDIANLYPLMVHVNLFGGGYLNSVETILKRFV